MILVDSKQLPENKEHTTWLLRYYQGKEGNDVRFVSSNPRTLQIK